MSFTDGVHYNMKRADYDRIARLNWSNAKHLGKSPAHYQHASVHGTKDTEPRQRGRAGHTRLLEPERFRSEYVVYDGRRAGKKWLAFQKEHEGAGVISKATAITVEGLAKGIAAQPAALPYMSGGKSEVTVLWTFRREAMGGIPGYEIECKSRLDFWANIGALVDYKSCVDASPSGFGKTAARFEYYVQGAFYVDSVMAATGKRLPYIFIAQEATAPHFAAVYELGHAEYELGRARYFELLDLYNRCREDNSWPGYGSTVMPLELPSWLVEGDDESTDLSDLLTAKTEAA